jgi:hypothetical protein
MSSLREDSGGVLGEELAKNVTTSVLGSLIEKDGEGAEGVTDISGERLSLNLETAPMEEIRKAYEDAEEV